ncbi:class I SAM-dependent methyltransferase [Streptomyces sp. NPDC048560]|uniref:class I SAM-dependent methyltransferase n=1 Tax=Streptomyces sp. NPDC048560 TaxID=3155488 RepID=UPI0034262224
MTAACFYCRHIAAASPGYTVRPALRDLGSPAPRCGLHWRYTCQVCQQTRHFMAIAYCPKADAYFCDSCATGIETVPASFHGWGYYFRYRSPWSGEPEPSLDWLEYERRHPALLRGPSPAAVSAERWLPRPTGAEAQQPADLADVDVHALWDKNARPWDAAFDDDGDKHRKYVTDEPMLALLGPAHGRRILDLGCGNGYLCRSLARAGAHVTGVDVSEEMIRTAAAYEVAAPLGIRYLVASATALQGLTDASFDAIVCNHVLTSVDDYETALAEAHRVLHPGGRMTAVISHPCFSCGPRRWQPPVVDSPRPEEATGYLVDHYLDPGAHLLDDWPGFSPVPYFHRPLTAYWQAFRAAGFDIEDFTEPGPTSEARAQLAPWEYNQAERIPLSCIFQLAPT